MHLQIDAGTTMCGRHDFDLSEATVDRATVDCPQCLNAMEEA